MTHALMRYTPSRSLLFFGARGREPPPSPGNPRLVSFDPEPVRFRFDPVRFRRGSRAGEGHPITSVRFSTLPDELHAVRKTRDGKVTLQLYRSADCIPNKNCMRTWFHGGATTVKREPTLF